ncbi:nucleotide disphospho-sugar-binding domain-containing protein [Streptomyces sp. NPDC053427]|uniref:nucleotide disphospho-sugar-binding domain-containing protein n=1 Tax=Streptomyces sp. NPDC053427 TaxID=3365701 RepID=UPI0037CDEFC0
MRVLFVAAAMKPHFYHLVTLAWAFRAAGHDVRVAGQPAIVEQVKQSGLPAVSVGAGYDYMDSLRELFNDPSIDLASIRKRMTQAAGDGRRTNRDTKELLGLTPEQQRMRETVTYGPYAKMAEAMAEDLVPFARAWRPDLVVTDPLPYVSALVAEVLRVPLVRHLWGPYSVRQLAGHGAPTAGTMVDSWPASLVELFERYGAAVSPDHARVTIDPTPVRLQIDDVPNRLPVRYVPYNGSGVVPAWLSEPPERPRVCVTWGTTTGFLTSREEFVVPTILKELAELDVEVVATLSNEDRERLGPLGERIRVVEGLPLDWLLPTCQAVVSQAGGGTMLTAVAHGIPQVTIPQTTDQPFNATKLQRAGAGRVVDLDDLKSGDIRDAASAVLYDESVREAARGLREEIMSQPSPAELVGTLEQLV